MDNKILFRKIFIQIYIHLFMFNSKTRAMSASKRKIGWAHGEIQDVGPPEFEHVL